MKRETHPMPCFTNTIIGFLAAVAPIVWLGLTGAEILIRLSH